MSQVNLDPNIRNVQELKSWPEFHNAVAAGLRLAPLQVFLDNGPIVVNLHRTFKIFVIPLVKL